MSNGGSPSTSFTGFQIFYGCHGFIDPVRLSRSNVTCPVSNVGGEDKPVKISRSIGAFWCNPIVVMCNKLNAAPLYGARIHCGYEILFRGKSPLYIAVIGLALLSRV